MQFEGIFTETMSGKFLHVLGNVDDFDGLEGAFFDTESTTNTEYF
jgi:hypothetical protein